MWYGMRVHIMVVVSLHTTIAWIHSHQQPHDTWCRAASILRICGRILIDELKWIKCMYYISLLCCCSVLSWFFVLFLSFFLFLSFVLLFSLGVRHNSKRFYVLFCFSEFCIVARKDSSDVILFENLEENIFSVFEEISRNKFEPLWHLLDDLQQVINGNLLRL